MNGRLACSNNISHGKHRGAWAAKGAKWLKHETLARKGKAVKEVAAPYEVNIEERRKDGD